MDWTRERISPLSHFPVYPVQSSRIPVLSLALQAYNCPRLTSIKNRTAKTYQLLSIQLKFRSNPSLDPITALLCRYGFVAGQRAMLGMSGGRRHAPAMTVSAEATQRQHEESVDEVVARLDNPTNAVVNAFKDSLRLFRDIEACDDPQLKEALTTAMQVRVSTYCTLLLSHDPFFITHLCRLNRLLVFPWLTHTERLLLV